ncbi:MAG: flagellar hook-length control protein FliK [Planctomycetota bacterium]
MIDTTFLTATPNPGAVELIGTSALDKTNVTSQAIDHEDITSFYALFSQFDEMAKSEVNMLPQLLLADSLALPEGKELPLLSSIDLELETELSLVGDFDPELNLENDDDALMAGLQAILPQLLPSTNLKEKTRVGEMPDKPRETAIASSKMAIAIEDVLETGRVSLSSASDDLVIKSDFTPNNLEMIKSNALTSERQVETPALVSAGINAKVSPTELTNPITNTLKLSIDAPVQQPKWGEHLAGRIAWMTMNNQQSAQINLNPAELGPIEVKVSLHNDQASVNFYAHNSTVRDAIEEAFPRLRDMLNENGLNLSQSSVSDQSLSQKQGQDQSTTQDQSHYPFAEDNHANETTIIEVPNIKLGLVDHFV